MDLHTCAAQASAHPRIHTPQEKDTLHLQVEAAAWLLTQDPQPNRILTGELSNLPDHLQCFFLFGSTSATPHGRAEQKHQVPRLQRALPQPRLETLKVEFRSQLLRQKTVCQSSARSQTRIPETSQAQEARFPFEDQKELSRRW